MRKFFVFVMLFMILPLVVEAQQIPTRLYTPIVKQSSHILPQTNVKLWEPSTYETGSIVCTGFIISGPLQTLTLAASDVIVKLDTLASRPVISPAGFLKKLTANEVIVLSVTGEELGAELSITLFGWEEPN